MITAGLQEAGAVPGPKTAPSKDEADPSTPIAMVNGEAIRLGDLNKAVRQRIPMTGHGSISEKRLAEIAAEELNALIMQEVLFQEAKRKKIKVTGDEREAEMKKMRGRFSSEEKYREALKKQGLTDAEIMAGVERHIVIRKLSDLEVRAKVRVTDEEMLDYYNDHPEQFQRPQQVRLRILLIGVDPSATPDDWEKARGRAGELADRARKGEDLAALVEQYSDEANAEATAGDTGLLHQGMLPYSELEPIAYDLEAGSISNPVETLYGYMVFRVEEKKQAQRMTFENLNKDLLRSELKESSTETKIREWIAGLRKKAEIEIY